MTLGRLLCGIFIVDHRSILLQIVDEVESFAKVDMLHQRVRKTVADLFQIEEAKCLSNTLAVHTLACIQRLLMLLFVQQLAPGFNTRGLGWAELIQIYVVYFEVDWLRLHLRLLRQLLCLLYCALNAAYN